ncbi:fatty-acid amide hydrolase 2-like protein, partial [Leptotrombidium deliense]
MFRYFKILIVVLISVVLRIYSYFFVKPRKNCIPPIDNEIFLKPAVVVANDIREGKLKSKDVVEIYLRRIQSVNKFINAIVDLNKNAVKEAEAIDEMVRRQNAGEESNGEVSIHDMPLLGVPVSTKDSVAIKGLLFTAGLYARRNTTADEDADIIKNLRKAGAIPIALTNVPELLMWSDSTNCIFGVTRNPYDLSRSPGGSTGGDAALLSSAGSVIGIGSDIAGSIRVPSFRCGIFGHKVTPKVMPENGRFPETSDLLLSLNTTGPM